MVASATIRISILILLSTEMMHIYMDVDRATCAPTLGATSSQSALMVGAPSPCASCKLLRRRCTNDCVFAPYFPSDDPHRFSVVHKVFGASNVSKMLQDIPIDQRLDAVSSLVFEATARVRDPVYGCVGTISYLQDQITQLQMKLAVAEAEIVCMQNNHNPQTQPIPPDQQFVFGGSAPYYDCAAHDPTRRKFARI